MTPIFSATNQGPVTCLYNHVLPKLLKKTQTHTSILRQYIYIALTDPPFPLNHHLTLPPQCFHHHRPTVLKLNLDEVASGDSVDFFGASFLSCDGRCRCRRTNGKKTKRQAVRMLNSNRFVMKVCTLLNY